ncbi:inositol monophosphatase family protein [Pelagibacterium montanilacus]|uniref:inositol monophosphatase family protein n=1 Tax=Pelagibacterium montanilacus TaxID=2185280 RepID=UPI000F8E6963|nr:inositol monophosphatase family protein [Pelagibacterium montanilacus]
MSPSDHNARHDLAVSISREAGALALDYFHRRDTLVIENKANAQDVVSIADKNVETLIRERVFAAFPEDGLIGEEHDDVPSRSGYTWVVDPIDGTSPFVAGLPDWCVSIAVRDETRTVASAIFVPCQDDLYHALRGEGAWLNERKLAMDPDLSLRNGLTGMGANYRLPISLITTFAERLIGIGGMFYRNGSGALMLAYVGAGKLAGYYESHINAWDCLAALLIVEEAGGYVNDFAAHGDLHKGDEVFAAAPAAREDLLKISEGLKFVP